MLGEVGVDVRRVEGDGGVGEVDGQALSSVYYLYEAVLLAVEDELSL